MDKADILSMLPQATTEAPASEYATNTYNPIAKQQAAEEQQRAVYKAYQENILITERGRSAILKGLHQGTDIYLLFLQATKVISLMTNDKLFNEQATEAIKAIYGEGLGEGQSLQLELEEVQQRLSKLTGAGHREDTDSY